jgi:hypothetical protein
MSNFNPNYNNMFGVYGNGYGGFSNNYGLSFSNSQYQQQPSTNMEYVNGIEGANASPVPPNFQKAFFDSNGKMVYVKITDAQGRAIVNSYNIVPIANTSNQNDAFVPRTEFDALAKRFDDFVNTFKQQPEQLNNTTKEG